MKIVWPGAGWDQHGPREHRADILPLMALLHGDAMVEALMREAERMANEPLPRAQCKKRIAALETELAEISYIEEAMVAAAPWPAERTCSARHLRRLRQCWMSELWRQRNRAPSEWHLGRRRRAPVFHDPPGRRTSAQVSGPFETRRTARGRELIPGAAGTFSLRW